LNYGHSLADSYSSKEQALTALYQGTTLQFAEELFCAGFVSPAKAGSGHK
jgi:hypothetical protein